MGTTGSGSIHLRHWGLRETPFRAAIDPRFFYMGPSEEEALARLSFLVDDRRRLGLLLGAGGSGKSLLLRVFADQMRRSGCAVALVHLLGMEAGEMMGELASALGLDASAGESPSRLWPRLTDRLAELRYQELSTVILLDDSDRPAGEAHRWISRLAQFDLSGESRITLVLASRPGQVRRLGRTLLEMVELRIDLPSWEQAQSAAFLEHRLSQAGCDRAAFDDSALVRLHELGGGVPRQIAHLADLALAAGAGEGLDQITAETVESVYEELGVIRV